MLFLGDVRQVRLSSGVGKFYSLSSMRATAQGVGEDGRVYWYRSSWSDGEGTGCRWLRSLKECWGKSRRLRGWPSAQNV